MLTSKLKTSRHKLQHLHAVSHPAFPHPYRRVPPQQNSHLVVGLIRDQINSTTVGHIVCKTSPSSSGKRP